MLLTLYTAYFKTCCCHKWWPAGVRARQTLCKGRLGQLTILVDVFSSRSHSWGRSCCTDIPHVFHRSGVSVWVSLQNLDSPDSVSNPSGIKLTQKKKKKWIYIYQMNVVAAYPTQKYLCSCLIQPFLCTVLLAPGIKKIMKMIHQDPGLCYHFQLFVCWGVGGCVLVLFQGFSVFGVYISKLPFVSLTTSRSLSKMRFSVNNTAPGAGCSAKSWLSQ